MRLAFVIILMMAIAAGLVHVRRAQIAAQAEIQRMEARRIGLRRDLWDAQVRLEDELRPEAVRRRAELMALDLHRTCPDRMIHLAARGH